MSIILNKGLSTEYIFPRNFSMDPPPWTKRLKEMERAYKHGSVITGDEMVEARPLRIWGTLFESTRQAFRDELDLMQKTCYLKGLTLHADEWWPNRFLYVDLSDFSREDYPTLRSGPVDILFRVTDPFWYSTTQSKNSQNGLGPGNLALITNGGQIEVSPTIHVRVATGNVTLVTLQNTSDANRYFTYTLSMAPPRGFRIRCASGEVHRWSGTGYFEDYESFIGTFYRLQPGFNQIVLAVVGGTVNIMHVWRNKWLG